MKNLLKVFLMCFITLFAFAGQMMGQQKTITGRVVDALNEGMPGVNVQVKGTTSGTITNIDGDFSISVPNTKSVLVFTFIGYVKQEVAVGNQTKLNIQMKDDTPIRDKIAISCMLRQIHESSSHAIRHGLYIKNRKRLFCP